MACSAATRRRGRADLPDLALRDQLDVPGATLFRAEVDGELAGMVLWMRSGERVYYHLGGYSAVGYRARAAYALFDVSLRALPGLRDACPPRVRGRAADS